MINHIRNWMQKLPHRTREEIAQEAESIPLERESLPLGPYVIEEEGEYTYNDEPITERIILPVSLGIVVDAHVNEVEEYSTLTLFDKLFYQNKIDEIPGYRGMLFDGTDEEERYDSERYKLIPKNFNTIYLQNALLMKSRQCSRIRMAIGVQGERVRSTLASHVQEYLNLKKSLEDVAFEGGHTIRYSPSIPFIYASFLKNKEER